MWRRLGELAALFFKLGSISFGGPAAHLALMEEEIVARRQWMSREQFLDLWGATYLIPGPNALEMTAHVGYQRAGWLGLVVSAAAFTLPAAILSAMLAWAYLAYGSLPRVAPFLVGIKPAMLAVIAVALWRLGRTAIKGWLTALVAGIVAAAALSGANEVLVLLAAALLGTLLLRGRRPSGPDSGGAGQPAPPTTDGGASSLPAAAAANPPSQKSAHRTTSLDADPACSLGARPTSGPRDGDLGPSTPSAHPTRPDLPGEPGTLPTGPLCQTGAMRLGRRMPLLLAGALAAVPPVVPLGQLTLFFLKVGAVLYGTGYVLIAYLEGGLVRDLRWLSPQQLLDAVAVGQITPGPLITTATFVGYLLCGPAGAAAATVGIILPGLLAVAITSPWIGRLRRWPWTSRFLDSVGAASLGLTAAVTLTLGRRVLIDPPSLAIAAGACLALLRWKLNPAWLILGGAVAGWLLSP